MLVLTRKKGDRILIGDRVVVTVVACKGGRVRLGFEAPDDVAIFREEVRNEFRTPAPLPEACGAPIAVEKG